MLFSIHDLIRREAFPHEVTHLTLRETHISWVLLTGPFAYKVKKPVHFDFVDASTLERRLALCRDELRLNRRFAPELYVDVLPIGEVAGHLRVAAAQTPIEYAVRMHEFDPAQQLDSQLETGQVECSDMAAFGGQLAQLHARAPQASAGGPYGASADVRRQMLDNLPPLYAQLRSTAERQVVVALRDWIEVSLRRLEPLMRSRLDSGWVRECHGDLHAGNIVRWRDRWLAFDCLEFDPLLRWIDVQSDAAFLFMDLTSRGGPGLAYAFLSRYLEEAGDYGGLRLLPVYAVYRALVRAKVDALHAASTDPHAAGALEARLRTRIAIAERLTHLGERALILMHGVSGSGKSWLSEQLVPPLHAVRVRSDLERKRLEGIASLERRHFAVGEGSYALAPTAATYTRLRQCAAGALEAGFRVIVDATFLHRTQRQQFRSLAQQHDCPFLIVSCDADRSTLEARLAQRADRGADPSEATSAVLDAQLLSREPLSADELRSAIRIDAGAVVVADIIERVHAQIAGRR